MNNPEYKFKDLTHSIIGCGMKVHSKMGVGYPEVVYQRCLAIEFDKQQLTYDREIEVPLMYEEQVVGTRRVDFLVEKKILVELKAVAQINPSHYNQIMNYLTAYKLEVGLLLNFGNTSLEFKRLVNSKNQSSPLNL